MEPPRSSAPSGPSIPKDKGEASFVDNEFLVKNMSYEGKTVTFCLQSFDGPCPLLAVANVLLLRAKLRIKPGVDRLKTSHLLALMGDSIANHLESKNDLGRVGECLNELKELQFGLPVNCGFRDCDAFERTAGFLVFDMLDIRVFHGWIPDEPEAAEILRDLTYNEAMILLASADELQMELDKNHDNNIAAEKIQLLQRGAALKKFFEASPTQLTFEGLFRLHAKLKEGELAVLFRNNHFSTITLRKGILYSLVTDVGYQHKDDYIWETLETVTGDAEVVDCRFNPVTPHITGPAEYDFEVGAFEYDHDDEVARREQAKADAEFARRLQQQEQANQPVGKLRSIGYDEHGREILVDEIGHKFIRKSDASKQKPSKPPKHSPRGGRRSDNEGHDDEEEEEEGDKKCVIF